MTTSKRNSKKTLAPAITILPQGQLECLLSVLVTHIAFWSQPWTRAEGGVDFPKRGETPSERQAAVQAWVDKAKTQLRAQHQAEGQEGLYTRLVTFETNFRVSADRMKAPVWGVLLDACAERAAEKAAPKPDADVQF